MTLEKIFEIADLYDFRFIPYEENGVLCGFEMETWTNGGVNMLHFVDCRRKDGFCSFSNVVAEIKEIYNNFDIDEEIDRHREDDKYRKAFSIRESVEDFEEYAERLDEFVGALNTDVAHEEALKAGADV